MKHLYQTEETQLNKKLIVLAMMITAMTAGCSEQPNYITADDITLCNKVFAEIKETNKKVKEIGITIIERSFYKPYLSCSGPALVNNYRSQTYQMVNAKYTYDNKQYEYKFNKSYINKSNFLRTGAITVKDFEVVKNIIEAIDDRFKQKDFAPTTFITFKNGSDVIFNMQGTNADKSYSSIKVDKYGDGVKYNIQWFNKDDKNMEKTTLYNKKEVSEW